MDTAGLVAITQSAPMRPAESARNRSTAFKPGPAAMFGACQWPRTSSASPGRSQSRWPASMVARAPTSRPPMAFGWPVTLKGPAPGLPMRPVSRWQLMIALALSVPTSDWFTPWLQRVTTRGVSANQRKKVARSAGWRPVSSAACGAVARAASSAAPSPCVCSAIHARSAHPSASRCARSAPNSATSEPGRSGRCRSAPSQVAVRRGSMTTTRIEGRIALAAATRWNSTGWHQARLLPTSTRRSALSRSS